MHFPPGMGPRPGGVRPMPQTAPGSPGMAGIAPTGMPQPGAGSAAQPAPGAPVVSTVPMAAPSLQDKPAQAARITLSGGSLSVEANNSSLSQILDQLASSSGMTVDGLGQKDQRVFGIYGPGNPRDILSSLLDGAGYNFLMVGATEKGTPRQIVLTARSNAPLTTAQNNTPSAPEPEEEEPPPPMPINTPAEEANPVAHPPSGMPGAQPRSPAEMLQEMQRIRQQQQQQPPQ